LIEAPMSGVPESETCFREKKGMLLIR
jgi:hypothetical protein